MSRPARVAVAVTAVAFVGATVVAATAATKLPNTGITLTKAAHEAGRLVITGTTTKKRQIVRLDSPKASKRSGLSRKFRLTTKLVPGDCSIRLTVGKKSDLVKVSSCGPTGPKGATGAKGVAGVQGPTGPAGPQGIAGPAGPQGAEGPAGATGPQGAEGPAGPNGLTEIKVTNGSGGSHAANANLAFVGPVANFNITAGQRIIGGGSVPLGSAAVDRSLRFGLCYQKWPDPILYFAGSSYQEVTIKAEQASILSSSTATPVLTAGTYGAGFCVDNGSASALVFDYVNAWFVVTN
jgi:hypothetical protein